MAVADLDPEFWEFGMTLFAYGALCPWLSLLDSEKFGRYVDGIEALDMKTIAGCHTPVIEGPQIKQAFDHVRRLPGIEPPPLPDQSILDQIIGATSLPVA
jgi:hypothetical protein